MVYCDCVCCSGRRESWSSAPSVSCCVRAEAGAAGGEHSWEEGSRKHHPGHRGVWEAGQHTHTHTHKHTHTHTHTQVCMYTHTSHTTHTQKNLALVLIKC